MTDNLTDEHLLNALREVRGMRSERATLRDQFAMAALTGLLANTNFDWPWDKCAERAYVAADFMLAAREEKK